MSDRPTPDTDAAWACFKGYMEPLQDVKDISRKLECERDEARRDLEFRRRLYKVQEEHLENARRERDEARAVAYDLAVIAANCLGSHNFALDDTALKIAAALKRWKKQASFNQHLIAVCEDVDSDLPRQLTKEEHKNE